MRASPEFRRFCEGAFAVFHGIASNIVAEGEEHVPMLMAFPTPDDPIPISLIGVSKDEMSRLHRTISMDMPCCMIVESWYVTADRRADVDEIYRENGGTLANHPLRKEAIMFNFMHKSQQLLAMCEINRETNTLGEPKWTDPFEGNTTGRFVLNTREGRVQ